MILYLLIVLFVPWTVVLLTNPPIFLLVLATTIVSILFSQKRRILTVLVLLLCLFQYFQITKTPLVSNSPVHQVEIKHNLAAYPPLPLPVAYWFEQKDITQKIFALSLRSGEVLSPSLYFFSNHPRERAGYREFEKFQYVLLPFFIYGLFSLFRKKKHYLLFILFVPGFILFTLFGNRGEAGPFLFFPFIASLTFYGLREFFPKRNKALIAFLVVFVLVTIQTYAYTIS